MSSHTLHLTVHKAHNLPRLKTVLGKKRRFYATVTDGERTRQTRPVRSVAQCVEWNENIDAFVVDPLSRMTISLYANRTMQKDILIGTQEIAYESRRELEIVFENANEHPTEATKLFLTITVSANMNSSLNAAVNNPILTAADQDDRAAEGEVARLTVQPNTETIQSMEVAASTSHLSQGGDIPIESSTLVQPAEGQIETSRAALRHAEEAMSNINTIKTWQRAVNNIKWVMDTVSPIALLIPHARTAWSLLSKIPEVLLKQIERDNNVETLLEAIHDAFEFAEEADALRNIKPESKQATFLEEMLECVSECAKFIQSYAEDVRVGKRAVKSIFGPADGEIDQYSSTLAQLRNNFLAHATVTIEVAVLEAELDAKIREMPYKGGWRFGDERRCLPGTREAFLNYIIKWVRNPKSERALVLLGQAGMGKSSIAHEVARRLDDKCLGSYFAFLRKERSKNEAYQLFTTLARDLSDRNPEFKRALGKVIKDKSSLRGTRDYRTLFECLLLEPLKNLPPAGPILIVIDALDESEAAIGKNGLHTFLAQRLGDLPPNFRFLITSRPESGVEPAFANARSVRTLYMDDPQLATNTEQDIGKYLRNELPENVFKDHGGELAKAAEGLFQWAAVACGFINSPASLGLSKKECVRRLLDHSQGRNGEGLLDSLYEEVLKEYFKSNEAQTVFRSVMGQLLATFEPLSITSLIALRQQATEDDEDSDRVLGILGYLGSLMSNVTSSDQTRPIIPLHTSFRDFLIDRKSNVFYVELRDAHHQLTHSCVGLMLDNLKFNICKLESSYLANNDVLNLESRISKYIPPALSYACLYWGDHLEHLPFEDELFKNLQTLLETKFLFWLEVMSIKSSVGLASLALSSLLMWLQLESLQTEVMSLSALVNDASAFVRYFGMAVTRSAPHIYISALPFAPSSSRIRTQYLSQFPRTLTLERGQLSHWPALEMTIQTQGGWVNSVAFSPDGQHIASASSDRRIRTWDATTGQAVAGPFTGHTNSVTCVAFSPDGHHIASASDDRTIRMWDAATGQVIGGLFTGHTDWIFSIAFSPDGRRIASASFDRTIRVWNATTGQAVVDPFTGHTDSIACIAFSQDGQRIASASYDGTILVWNSATGQTVAGPFTGHSDFVRSVTFSPDGQHIASASDDGTIRVWDAVTGRVVAGPFTGHSNPVTCVAFSPHGQRIASASDDRTIRVWDAATGEVVAGPFTGHTHWVFSAVFSFDGQRIASASSDGTIRVWNATTREVLEDSFIGHLSLVTSVAFSYDGKRIASASDDGMIYLWDAATGQVAVGPFTEQASSVNSVAFSPDGHRIASASSDHTIYVWDAATGQVVAGPFTGHTSSVNSVAFSPDGQRIASASSDHTICVWDAVTGQVTAGPFIGHSASVTSVTFSPDGQRIASASFDHSVYVWDAATGQVVLWPYTGHTSPVYSVAFSPDGQRCVSASYNDTICVWDATTGDIITGPFTAQTISVNSVAFSPDGQRIASASYDGTIRVWDAATGEVVAGPFIGHASSATCVAFSPDGRLIASASTDRTIRVWDATAGQLAADTFTEHSTDWIRSMEFSPGGPHTASASGDLAIHVEKVVTGEAHFTDQSLINDDGWIYGAEKELLLWIPEIHRSCLHRPSTVWIAGEHDTQLDLSEFVHGSNWALVHDRNLST